MQPSITAALLGSHGQEAFQRMQQLAAEQFLDRS